MAHDAAVIIPHYNDPARLYRCLTSLSQNALIARTDVVVVDSGPIQSSPDFQSKFPNVRFLHEPVPGAAHARNKGVAHTTAPLLFFVDCDCVPGPQWLTFAFSAALQNQITGGAIDLFDETPGPRSAAQAFEAVFAFHQKSYIERKGFSVTANLVTNRVIFDSVGPFRDGVSEDMDWCHRARAKGFAMTYKPQLRVKHPTRQDWQALKSKWQRVVRETHQLNQSRIRWIARGVLLPLSVIAHIPKIILSQQLPTLRDKRSAAYMLIRLRLWRAVEAFRLSLRVQTRA